MTNNQVAILVAVIAGVFGLGGNLVTAFGPSWISWGTKPSFVDTEVYKELRNNNSRLNETLEEQLLHIDAYYLSRDLIFEFREKTADRLIIEAKNTTVVKNALDRKLTYTHSVSFDEDIKYVSVVITGEDGQTTNFDERELSRKRAALPVGIIKSDIPWVIPPKGKVTIESRYVMNRPLWFQEPMVTARLIAGPMTITIREKAELKSLAVDWIPLAFRNSPRESRDQDKNSVITIPGPVFSGQGIVISWKWKG